MNHKTITRPLSVLARYVVYGIVRLLGLTYRIEEYGLRNLTAAQGIGPAPAYILAIWHETVLPITLAQVGRPYCTMASRSNAGRVVSFIMTRLGFFSAHGSRSGGGREARTEAIDFLRRGVSVAIATDGSSGPRRVVKPGAVDMARKSGQPILPAFSVSIRPWILGTWDLMRIPRPFSRIKVLYGEPIRVPPETEGRDFELLCERIAQALNDLEAEGLRLLDAEGLAPGSLRAPRS